ncbi:MAG: hypothetical protein J6L69_09725 [Lachnospiraceae bacterium]|nr:hypothetical protein [Lachnospiraceae bacterium]
MKKMKLLSLMLVVCMLFTACQSSEDKESAAINDSTGSENSNSNLDSGNSTENMVWFPKSGKCSSEDGNTNVRLETTLEDGKLIYHYISYGVNEKWGNEYENTMGFEIEFDDKSATAFYDLRQYYDGIEKTKLVFEYDETNNCYNEKDIDVETGEYSSYNKYEYVFDDEGKIVSKTSTWMEGRLVDDKWVYEPGNTSYETLFEYTEDGYYVITGWGTRTYTLANGEKAECTKRIKKFIPYDTTKNYYEYITFHLPDGNQVCVNGYDDFDGVYADNTKMTEFVYNSEGYLIEAKAHLGDGSVQDIVFENKTEVTYDDAGNVLTYVRYYEGEVSEKGTYTYDEHGNLTHVEMILDGEKYEGDIEWMLVPDYLAANKMFPYGDGYYAISELIEDAIPERFFTDRENYVITKDALSAIVNALK